MKKYFILAICLFTTWQLSAQNSYRSGYFLNNEGQRTEGLIRYVNPKNNPTAIQYKLTSDSPVLEAAMKEVKEFTLHDVAKFERHEVSIDRSSVKIAELDWNKNPNFKTETLFLKVLMEGEINLYLYEAPGLIRFFTKKGEEPVEQLIYRKYFVGSSTTDKSVAQNELFKSQLYDLLDCGTHNREDFKKLAYTQKDILNVVEAYNQCTGKHYTDYYQNAPKENIAIRVRPGVTLSSLNINGSTQRWRHTDFGWNPGYRFGMELEYNFPFFNQKWSFILEPNLSGFSSTFDHVTSQVQVTYQALEIPLGFKYYYLRNDQSKAFLTMVGHLDFPGNSMAKYGELSSFSFLGTFGGSLGAGYEFKKFSTEMRYTLPQNKTKSQLTRADLQSVALIFGYRVF